MKLWIALIDTQWITCHFFFSLARESDKYTQKKENVVGRKFFTDSCYDSKRKVKCSRKFPLCTGFMRLIFYHNVFKFNIFSMGYIIWDEHARFGHLVLSAQQIFCIRFERVEYGRTNQQVAEKKSKFEVFFSILIFLWTYLNVETMSVKVRTFCFFILAPSTHGLGQH